jgi:cytoskeletal protein RodZ
MLIQCLTGKNWRSVWQAACTVVYKGFPKFNKEKLSMTQRVLLSLVCGLALILIPVSYSSLWAQSNYPSTTQQDKTGQKDVNQNQANPDQNQTQTQSNQDLNQSNQSSPDANASTATRQKPSSSENNPNTSQNQNRTDNKTDQNAKGNQKLPNTAGELPLLALIGLLSLSAAAGTRVLARIRSNR